MIHIEFTSIKCTALVFILINFFVFTSYAQENKMMKVVINRGNDQKQESIKSEYKEIGQAIINYLEQAHNKGFLEASVDSIIIDTAKGRAEINYFSGEKYYWGKISCTDKEKAIKRRTKLHKLSEKSFSLPDYEGIHEKIIQFYEQNGYPFVKSQFKSININNGVISADLVIEKGPIIAIDTLIIKGEAKISRFFLQRYLDIQHGDLYNEKTIADVDKKINNLAFLQTSRNTGVEFYKNKAAVYAFIKPKKANVFNGLVGFVPDDEKEGKVIVTGELELLLYNAFKKGEKINISWEKPQDATQQLFTNINIPYIFKSSVGLDAGFNLYKQDTSYLTVNPQVKLNFYTTGANHFRVFYNYKNSFLLSTKAYENHTKLPGFADVSASLFGVGYHFSDLDYALNPRSGWVLNAGVSTGNKEIRTNPGLKNVDYSQYNLSSTQYELNSNLTFYFELATNFVCKFYTAGGWMINEQLFENEMYRLGGIKTLRGIEENAIFASAYSLSTVELRYLFNKNSNFFLFFDGGYYEKQSEKLVSDFPFGFGAGVNFETRAGIFSLNYALGRQFNNPIELRASKVHVGYVNKF